METEFAARKVTERVYWVGAVDWSVRNFHGYKTGRGTSYNAYLLMDKDVTLIDGVKAPFAAEQWERICSVTDPAQIKFVVSNHSEPDHSGSLRFLQEKLPQAKFLASNLGEKALKSHYGEDFAVQAVKDGDTLNIGRNTLHFAETKLLHWPDSMFTFMDDEKVLFSQDAFGMHLAITPMWSDQYDAGLLTAEARKYFANILLPYSAKVLALLDKFPGFNWPVEVIAPDHGPLHRGDKIAWILDLYRECAEQKMRKNALVVFSTMWHSTEKLAFALAEGIRQSGVDCELADLAVNDRSAIATKVLDSGLVAFGSPTMNNQIYPAMADVLTYLKGLKPQNHVGFAFGAFGWSGEAPKQLQAALTEMKFELPFAPFVCKYVPTADTLRQMVEQGRRLGQELLAKI